MSRFESSRLVNSLGGCRTPAALFRLQFKRAFGMSPSLFESRVPRRSLGQRGWRMLGWSVAVSILLTAISSEGDAQSTSNSEIPYSPISKSGESYGYESRSRDTDSFHRLLLDPLLQIQQSDATIRDIEIATMDRAFAVGDRGLILATEDGGKQWHLLKSPVTCPLYDIVWLGDQTLVAVGGYFNPGSGFSQGVILTSKNFGRSWRHEMPDRVALLRGVQQIDDLLIAWGDSLASTGTGVYLSDRNASNWKPTSLPIGSIECARWLQSDHGLAVDRIGRVLEIREGQVTVLNAPSRDIRCIDTDGERWWLGGNAGVLLSRPVTLQNETYQEFETHHLPGNASDNELFELSRIRVSTDGNLLVAGFPGSVVWKYHAPTRTTKILQTRQTQSISALAELGGDRVLVGTAFGNLFGSRNGGTAFWPEQRNARRPFALSVCASASSIPWLANVYSCWELCHHSSVTVIHEEDRDSALRPLADSRTGLQARASQISLTDLRQWPDFPVGIQSIVQRSSEKFQYYDRQAIRQKILRKLIAEIRSQRPSILICEPVTAGSPLRVACSAITIQAATFAADQSYKLFSDSAQIPNTPWQMDKILSQAAGRGSGDFRFAAEQPLKRIGLRFEQILGPKHHCSGILDAALGEIGHAGRSNPLTQNQPSSTRSGAEAFLLVSSRRRSAEHSALEQYAVLSPETARSATLSGLQKQTALVRWSRGISEFTRLVRNVDASTRRPTHVQINSLADIVDASQRPLLLQWMSNQFLNSGDLQSWLFCAELLLQTNNDQEVVCAEWLRIARFLRSDEISRLASGTSELERMKDDVLRCLENASYPKNEIHESLLASDIEQRMVRQSQLGGPPLTPFDTSKPRPSLPGTASKKEDAPNFNPSPDTRAPDVQFASAEIQIDDPSAQMQPDILFDSRFNHTVLQWDVTPIKKTHQRLSSLSNDTKHDWRIESLLDALSVSNEKMNVLTTFENLSQYPLWHRAARFERSVDSEQSTILSIPVVESQPRLDGVLEREFWAESLTLELYDPRQPEMPARFVALVRNQTHLFLAAIGSAQQLPDRFDERTHDSIDWTVNRFEIRFDLDRDYDSNCLFAIDQTGHTGDEIAGLKHWNPEWFVASNSPGNANELPKENAPWIIEVAIPFTTLMPTKSQQYFSSKNSDVILCDFRQIHPEVGVFTSSKSISDAFDSSGAIPIRLPLD